MKKFIQTLFLAGVILLAGCGDDNDFVFTPNNPIAAPVAVNDTLYTTNQNTPLTVNAANGVLINDAPNGGTITAFDATSTQNGTVALLPDGGFTYTPPNGLAGADSFTYTLTNSAGSSTATVTITVQVVNGFFVDAQSGNDTTGAFNGGLPYATIQAAVTAAAVNDTIVVRSGNYTGAVTLKNGQRLLGSGSALVNAQGTVRPQLTGPVNLANGNTVDFIRIQGTNGDAIVGNTSNGATITNNEIANTTNNGAGIAGDGNATGSWTIQGNTITNVSSIGIVFAGQSGDNLVARVNNNVITGSQSGALGFSYSGTGTVRAQVTGNTMTGTVIPGSTFEVIASNNAELGFRITGNTNDDAYTFARNESTAKIEVERLTELLSINSGSATLENPVGATFPAVGVPENTFSF